MSLPSPPQRRGRQVGQGTLDAAVDPEGRLVKLTRARWNHIVAGHPELRVFRGELMRAVRRPNLRVAGRRPQEQWFYLAGVRPSRWLKVVVRYQGAQGWIIVFARRSTP